MDTRTPPPSKESRLARAIELLRVLVPEYDGTGFQTRITEALRVLQEIPR